MSESWNNVKTVCCKPWLVLPTVYSDALSYGEQLDKFCYSLNKLIENNNILPDFIADKIKEYISSGAIGEVVQEILANYILNVKYPPKGVTPAVGDGSADDTEAIQGCIDYAAKNGGVVYFPYGSYLTQPLTMKNEVSLFGFDRYSTKIVLKGGATKALLNGNGNNLSVCNLTLDGNSGIQVNEVNVVDMTGSNLMFNDLVIKDGYKLFNFTGNGHLQLSNIVFGNAVENCFTVDGNVIVQTNNLLFTALSKVSGVSVVDIRANCGNYDFNSVAKCDTCMLISGNDNKVVAMIGGATKDYADTGEHNNVEIVGHSHKKYYSGDVKKDANNSETTLQGTRSLHVVGNSTVAFDSDSTESVDGNKSEIVTGVTTETYKGDRTVTDNNKTEIVKRKILNANDLILNTVNPLTYKTPSTKPFYSTVPFKDNLDEYNVMVENENTKLLNFNNAKKYGVTGDGITDDSDNIQTALNACKGKSLYFPCGTYLITKTIVIPSDTFMFGDGTNTVFIANNNNFDMFVSESFYELTGTDKHDMSVKNIYIKDVVIDGNYLSGNDLTVKTGRYTGRGLCLYCNNYHLENVTVCNNPEEGIWLENTTYYNPPLNLKYSGEWSLTKCCVKFNGKHGLYSKNTFDYVILNSTFASNSRSNDNTYDNVHIESGNIKMIGCHMYNNYGLVKTKSSLYLGADVGATEVTGCHIEGAYTPLISYAPRAVFVNSIFYASFGVNDVEVGANGNTFIGCVFSNQNTDTSHVYKKWKGAFKFSNNARNIIVEKCIMNNTPFSTDLTGLGELNTFDIVGYNNTDIDNNFCMENPGQKANVTIRGDFGKQSEFYRRSLEYNLNYGRVLVIGDSFTAGDGIEYKWYNLVKDVVVIPQMEVFAYGGAGFIAKATAEQVTFKEAIQTKILPNIDKPDEITLVIIQGGLNDGVQNYEEEKTAVTQTLYVAKKSFPNAKVIGLTSLNYDVMDNNTLYGINDGFVEQQCYNTVNGNSWLAFGTDLVGSDNKHPNKAGHSYIGRMFCNWLFNGNANIYRKKIFGDKNNKVVITVHDNYVSLLGSGNFEGLTKTSNYYKLFDLPTNGVYWPNNQYFPIYTNAGLGYLWMYNKEVRILPPGNGALTSFEFNITSAIPTFTPFG